MKKDEIYEIIIEDIGNDGEGIGHIKIDGSENGFTVFVKDAVVGDTVRVKLIKVKKTYAYGRLMEIIRPSEYRVEPICTNARRCGGCAIMQMDYEKQKEYKWNKVKDCLERIGGIADAGKLMEPIIGMEVPYNYRNKMQFPVGLDKDGNIRIGFYAGRTHSIIDMEECHIGHPVNTPIVKHLRKWLTDRQGKNGDYIYNEITGKGLVRHILTRVGFATGELMVCMVINGDRLCGKDKKNAKVYNDSLIECLSKAVEDFNSSIKCKEDEICNSNKLEKIKLTSVSININKENTNKILGDKCVTIYGQDYITDYIGENAFCISPLSFYQVNPTQTKVLYDKAIEYANLKGDEIVWDMYCGIGTISLSLARAAKKVYGVEIVPQAIEDAKNNAKKNNIANVGFFCGKAEEVVPAYMKGELSSGRISDSVSEDLSGRTPDVVVVDPPRKGCDSILLDTIEMMAPKRLVYVSCDPATLARDVKIMGEKGYKVSKVAVVDQFCHSTHVETVCLLSRKAPV